MDLILLYLHPGLFHAFTGNNFDSFQIFSELYGVTTTDIIISRSKLITQIFQSIDLWHFLIRLNY